MVVVLGKGKGQGQGQGNGKEKLFRLENESLSRGLSVSRVPTSSNEYNLKRSRCASTILCIAHLRPPYEEAGGDNNQKGSFRYRHVRNAVSLPKKQYLYIYIVVPLSLIATH